MSNRKYYKYIFVIGVFILQMLFLVGLLLNYDGNQANVFFEKANNYLADYINVAKYSVDRNPYFNMINGFSEHAYFPLTYVIFWVLSKLSNYAETDAFTAGYTNLSIAEINFIFLLLSLIFLTVLRKLYKEDKFIDDWLTISLFGSGIYLFSFERGNVIFAAAICVVIYLKWYESEHVLKKHIAFIALAIAAGLKGYPALLGVLLIYKKRWKDAAWLLLYGFILCFGPFALLKNDIILNIMRWSGNLKMSNEAYAYGVFPRFGYLLFLNMPSFDLGGQREHIEFVLKLIMIICCTLMVVTNQRQNTEWKKIMSLLLILILYPTNSAIYCGLYLFPAMLMFFKEKNHNRRDILYVILFVIFCNPFQIIIKEINITWCMVNLSAMLMFLMLLVENVYFFFADIRGKNEVVQI